MPPAADQGSCNNVAGTAGVPHLSIVIPAYNEAKRIRGRCRRFGAICTPAPSTGKCAWSTMGRKTTRRRWSLAWRVTIGV